MNDWSTEELLIEEEELMEQLYDIECRLDEVREELASRDDYE
jgi:hypothetical protein